MNSLNKEIDNKIAALQSDLSVIEQEALSLQEELDGLDAEIASLESDIAALEAQVSALETQIQENTEAIKKKMMISKPVWSIHSHLSIPTVILTLLWVQLILRIC